MKMAVTTNVKDPVCGMTIDAASAAGESEFEGKIYHFCSKVCLETFKQNPSKYAASGAPETVETAAAISANGGNGSLKNEDVLSGRRNDHSTANGAGERVDLPITGMTCAACANRIENQLKKQPGVEACSVNFATSKATINYDTEKTSVGDLIQTVKDTGYDTAGTAKVEFVVDDENAGRNKSEFQSGDDGSFGRISAVGCRSADRSPQNRRIRLSCARSQRHGRGGRRFFGSGARSGIPRFET
jgi:copper chaperone CopZ/YHS domain-containing protein